MTVTIACKKKSKSVAPAPDGIKLKNIKNSVRNSPTTREKL
jgi:hypothetical protein